MGRTQTEVRPMERAMVACSRPEVRLSSGKEGSPRFWKAFGRLLESVRNLEISARANLKNQMHDLPALVLTKKSTRTRM